jgi:hypothetical protein
MDSYHYQICVSCATSGLFSRSIRQLDDGAGPSNSHWICSKCSPSQSDPTETQSSSLSTSSQHWPNDLLQVKINSTLDSSTSSTSTITAADESDYLRFLRSCKGTTFCHLNANSVRIRFEEINYLLSLTTIAAFAITESKLDSDRDSSTQFQVKNYNSVRVDRNHSIKKSGGGILIYIHETFTYEQLDFDSNNFPCLTEFVILKLSKPNFRPVILCTLYNNPESSKAHFIEGFKELNLFLYSLSYEKIILGDFNINLLSNLETFDLNSHKLFLACKEFNLWQLMCGPTHQNGSLIDHVYVSERNNFPYFAHFPFGGSDHDLCIISRKVNSIRSDPRYISVRNLKSVDWISFQNSLLQYEFQPELNQDLADTEFWKLNNFVLHELDKVAPIRRKRVKGVVNPWFTHEVRSMCHDRDAAKKIALRSQSVNDWKIYRRKRNAATDFISKSKKILFVQVSRKT